jgi:hypothetical protein
VAVDRVDGGHRLVRHLRRAWGAVMEQAYELEMMTAYVC